MAHGFEPRAAAARLAATTIAVSLSLYGAGAHAQPTAHFDDFRYAASPQPGAPVAAPRGRYLNPVIAGSHADPSIVRVGRDYYLASSSLTFWPGIPIFHSRDLVHWTRIAAAVSRPDQMRIAGLDTWQGLYAPDLKWHAGRFYLLGTCYACGGNFIMTAPRAEGPWSKPAWLPFEGIDPSLFVDADGRAYVLNNGPPPGAPRWEGHRAIWLQEIDLATLEMRGPRSVLVDGGVGERGRPFWVEGPHLIRRDNRYVLIAAQGGTKENHHEVAFRADALRGPYVARDVPILTQQGLDPRRPNRIVQAGHADLVETPAGDWWAVFLASRPFGPAELDYTNGRETFLLPVTWRDGWPVILPAGQAVPPAPLLPRLPSGRSTDSMADGGAHGFVERWRTAALNGRWVTLGTPDRRWWRTGAGLSLDATTATLGDTAQPALLATRQSASRTTISVSVTLLDPAGIAGLAAYAGRDHHWALLLAGTARNREVRVVRRIGQGDPAAGTVVARAPAAGIGPVGLRIAADGPALDFAFDNGSGWRSIGPTRDGRTLAVSTTGSFIGTLLGVVALKDQRAASSTATP